METQSYVFVDRVMLPDVTFKYYQKAPFCDRYLSNKSVHPAKTSDAPSIWLW